MNDEHMRMKQWCEASVTDDERVSFELDRSFLLNEHGHINSKDDSSINSACEHSAKDKTGAITSSASSNIEYCLAHHNESLPKSNTATLWLELSCNKHTLDDLKNSNTGETFAIIDSDNPLNNEGASLLRSVVIKESEGSNGGLTVWKLMDERYARFTENMKCDEDDGLRAE